MIYVASLSVQTVRAMKKNCMQSSMGRIISQLHVDPEVSLMDTVIVGPKDLVGDNHTRFTEALKNKHPDICVIYLFENEADRDLLTNVNSKQYKKIKDSSIREACEEFLTGHMIKQGKGKVSSEDFITPSVEYVEPVTHKLNEEEDFAKEVWNPDVEVVSETPVPVEEATPVLESRPALPTDTMYEEEKVEEVCTNKILSTEALNIPQPSIASIPERKLENYLTSITNFEDWVLFKEHLSKESLVRTLIEENSEYAGLMNILDVLEARINCVWTDTTLNAEQKFEKIKGLGLERSVAKAATNSVNIDKAISIITTVITSAKRTVDERLESIDSALYKISTDKRALSDTAHIDKAVEERTRIQLQLLEMGRSIVDLYKTMDALTNELILDLDTKLPSANQFINEMIAPVCTTIFTPANTAALANKMLVALQQQRATASMLEESVQNTIALFFSLIEKDTEIIRKQKGMIDLLKANRVEDFVIVDGVLKNVLNLYTGADSSGRTATALTWSGVLSRRSNTLLIDLTGRSKLSQYGVEPIDFFDFLNQRIERPLLCVESNKQLNPIEVADLIQELKTRLNYYKVINVIVAPEAMDTLNQLSEEAFCVHYITNCTQQSMDTMREVITQHKIENIARKLIAIDSPLNPLVIAERVGADATQTRIIMLPNSPVVKACALRNDRPYEHVEVIAEYEEAFR